MSYRIPLFSALLVWTATCGFASQPNAPVVVSDQSESLSDLVPMPDRIDFGVYLPEKPQYAAGTCFDECGSCGGSAGCPSRGGGHGSRVGRMLGFGCENGCCGNTCNMPQHLMYYPADHGYYYFSPYNYRTVLQQKLAVTRYGGDSRNPYDNTMFQSVYEGLEPVSFELSDPRPPQQEAPRTLEPRTSHREPRNRRQRRKSLSFLRKFRRPPYSLRHRSRDSWIRRPNCPRRFPHRPSNPLPNPLPAIEPAADPAVEPAADPAVEPAAGPVVDPFGDEASTIQLRPVAPTPAAPAPLKPTVVPTVMLAPEMVLSETESEPRAGGSRRRPVLVTFEGQTVQYENR
jgi:hypothetical protein